MELIVTVSDIIRRPVDEVFDAVVQPSKMCGYFISSSSGALEEGKTVIWSWNDAGVSCEVEVLKVIPQSIIQFNWSASGRSANVYLEFSEIDSCWTKLKIVEEPFNRTEEGIALALGQTQGWTDFICSLKAWLYTGVNLRNETYSKTT